MGRIGGDGGGNGAAGGGGGGGLVGRWVVGEWWLMGGVVVNRGRVGVG